MNLTTPTKTIKRRTEYGAAGAVGLALGVGNPCAEPEMRVLLGPDVALFAARIPEVAASCATLERRLEEVDAALAEFAGLPVDIIAVATSGLAYSAGDARWGQALKGLEGYRGFATVSAAQATAHALEMLSVRRIALVTDARLGTAQNATRFF
ncbi:MAG: hypothetical protein IT520_08415, partial [Burkholderiales bacterium]|nr:hypothetical protein [Burkholderiales bacterium]